MAEAKGKRFNAPHFGPCPVSVCVCALVRKATKCLRPFVNGVTDCLHFRGVISTFIYLIVCLRDCLSLAMVISHLSITLIDEMFHVDVPSGRPLDKSLLVHR